MVLAHDIKDNQRSKDVQISQDVTFDSMFLSPNTLEGLKNSGFRRPSPVQLHGIPLGKCGFDMLLEAKSGTGKTAVFTIIALEKLDLEKGLQVVILAPTREIAAQICDVIRQIGCYFQGLNVEVVMGGLPVQDDIQKFKEKVVHIVVGSPGRLQHLINNKTIDVKAARLLILDEADKLMEKSFLPDIRNIFLALPEAKQVIMSSATYPDCCKEFIEQFLHDPQHICPNSDCVLLGVVQKVTYVKYNSNTVSQTGNRFIELLKIITSLQFKQCLIFCNYQARIGEVYKKLIKENWPAEQLYGAQDQVERLDALKTLQEYKCRILISTDLAARGIDASNVDLVINFEPPFEWQTYLHRIGRAGRFGSYGMAITIVSEGAEQKKFINLLSTLNLAGKVNQLWKEDKSLNIVDKQSSKSATPNQFHTNGHRDGDCTELWKIICDTENLANNTKIENFHELFDSFQHTHKDMDNIESFSDLVSSFQSSCFLEMNECQYKCITMPNISAKQYINEITKNVSSKTIAANSDNCDSHKNEKNCQPITNNSLNESNYGGNKTNNGTDINEGVLHENKVKNVHNLVIDNVLLNKDTSLYEWNCYQKRLHNGNSNEDCKTKGTDAKKLQRNITNPYNHAMSQKKSLHNSIPHSSQKNIPCSNSNENIKIQRTRSKKSEESHKQNKHAFLSKTVLHNSDPHNSCHLNQSCSSSEEDKISVLNLEKTNTQINRQPILQEKSFDHSGSHTPVSATQNYKKLCHNEKYLPQKSYIDWYKQLKQRIKEIEFAIYIDEISKL